MNGREQLEKVVAKLVRNRFEAVLAGSRNAALEKVLEWVPLDATVGVANSVTLRQLGLMKALRERGTIVLDPVAPSYGLAELDEATFMPNLLKATLDSDVFLSGTNALTEDGKLVNVDGLGNRVTGIIFGAPMSIVIVGRNKLVRNVDDALGRIKNTITPALIKRRQIPLPCARAGKCVDCSKLERACNITVIIERRPSLTDLKVIVVDEDLGLGWDPSWPKARIDGIRKKYEQFDWPYVQAWREFKGKFRKR